MAEKSGFFNALKVDDIYDRKYNADDYSDNLAVIISNGVLRSTNDDLKVTATGMKVSVGAGRGWIKGHYYLNDSTFTFDTTSAPVGGKRYDRVMLRLNNEVLGRKISLVYVQGTAAATPTKPAPTRTDTIYDLVLADIFVDTNATSLVVTDTRSDSSICGWIYSTSGDNSFFTSLDNSFGEWFQAKKDTLASVTLFKKYVSTTTLASPSNRVIFDIPQYDADTCFIEVYVNGINDRGYTLNSTTITFDGTLTAGTVVTVYCYKSIDGTGIMSVSDEITQLQQQMAVVQGVNKYTYKCTGLNDNIALSEIAQAFQDGSYTSSISSSAKTFLDNLGGNTYLAGLPSYAQITINVVGALGATTPFYGAGTTASRYRWFSLGFQQNNNHRLIFDFSECQQININCLANTSNIIFYGKDLNIKNANVHVNGKAGVGCHVQMIGSSAATGTIDVDNSHLVLEISGKGVIAENGNFTNCYCYCSSTGDHSLLFCPTTEGLVRLNGGTYYAYIATSGKTAAVMYVYATETNAVILANNINCPTVSLTGFSQQYLCVAYAGKTFINNVCSTMDVTGTYVTVTNQAWKSKR